MKQARWLDKNIGSLKGKTYIVTGATSGVGLEAAKSLLYKGAKVYFAIRNKAKAERCIAAIREEIESPKIGLLIVDQADHDSIRKFYESLPDEKIDGVILNAAIYYPTKGSVSCDGTNSTFYTNTVGTYLVYEALRAKYPGIRYVFCGSVANIAPKKHDFSALISGGSKDRGEEYAVSKRGVMNIFGYALLHYQDDVVLCHPGVTPTNILGGGYAPWFKKLGNAFLYVFTHKPWKAGLSEVMAVAGNGVRKGDYIAPRGPFHISGYPTKTKLPKKKALGDAEGLYECLRSNY